MYVEFPPRTTIAGATDRFDRLPIAEIVDVLLDCLVAVDLEGLEKCTAGGANAKVLIENKRRVWHRVEDAFAST